MEKSARIRTLLSRLLMWTAAAGLVFAIVQAYRWAEPSPAEFTAANTAVSKGITLHLEKTPFAGYVSGYKTWTLWAGTVDMERLPNAGLSTIQDATLTDLREGILYETVKPPPAGVSPSNTPSSSRPTQVMGPERTSSAPSGPVLARFHAKQGHYILGTTLVTPPELDLSYRVQWQFKLTGEVDFQTRAGERLHSQSLTIYALINKRTQKPEQRIVCEEGAQLSRKDVQITANLLRYNPADRFVECLGGVRGAFKDGSMQSERAFFSVKDEVLRCPDTVTGTIKDMPYTAEGVTLDLKNRRHHANHIHIQPRIEEGEMPRLP